MAQNRPKTQAKTTAKRNSDSSPVSTTSFGKKIKYIVNDKKNPLSKKTPQDGESSQAASGRRGSNISSRPKDGATPFG